MSLGPPRIAVACLIGALGCEAHIPAPASDPELEVLAVAYRRRHDLTSLMEVVGRLEPGLPRAEVARRLGPPDGWDDPSVFYRGDRRNGADESMGVTLDFYLWYTDGRPSTPSDRLERWTLGPGNRWEEGDPRQAVFEPPPPRLESAAPDAIAAHYRQSHDYESLRRLVPRLQLGVARGAIERVLGTPDHCEVEKAACHYRSDRKNAAGLALGVTVDYRLLNVDGDRTVVTDRLQSVSFGPVAD